MATLIENVNRIYTDKEAIKQAIIEKGVAVPEETSLDEYANLIAQINGGIDTSAVTAVASDVLAGKVIVDANGNEITGTLNDYSETDVLPRGETAQIVSVNKEFGSNGYGYYGVLSFHPNFSGYITPNTTINQAVYGLNPNIIKSGELIGSSSANGDNSTTGTYTSDATATAGNILSGKTAYVNGSKVTGTMTNYGREPVAGGIARYDNDLYLYVPNYSENSEASGCIQRGIHTPLSNLGNATASKVLAGNTFTSSAGLKITGTIASKAAATYTPSTANQTIAAGQYLAGAQTIKGDANLIAANIISGKSIFGINGTASTGYKLWSTYCNISDGEWSGVTLKDSAWVTLSTSSLNSYFRYYHNLNLDLTKVHAIGGFLHESAYYIRQGRGTNPDGTATTVYRYFPRIYTFGTDTLSVSGQFTRYSSYITSNYDWDNYSGQSSSASTSVMRVTCYSNYIDISFVNNNANIPLSLHSTTPKFGFFILHD